MRTIHAVIAAAAAAALAHGSVAEAQFIGNRPRERYEQKTKGASIEDFVKKLESDDPDTRLEAVKSLGESGEPKAVDYLVQALGDPDVRIRAKAIDMLGKMRATEATPVLIQYLFLRTTDPQMKNLILASLGKIGDPRATQPIIDFLQRDLDAETRGTAIFALGDIGSVQAEPTLTQISNGEGDSTLKRLASEALGKVRHRQAAASAEANQPADVFLPKPTEQ